MQSFKRRALTALAAASTQIGLFLLWSSAVLASAQPVAYHLTKKYEIGGAPGWDYIAIDSDARRLYVPHVSEVEVLDADTGKILGRITNTPGVHGIALAPGLRKAFTSNGSADTVSVVNLDSLAHIEEVKVGKDPDAIIYDPGTNRVFVSNGESDDVTAINAVNNKVAGTIPVGGGPEYLATDGKGTLWVNVQEKNSFVTIDGRNLTSKNTTSVPGCKDPTSLAADAANRRLFIGCRGGTLAIVNAESGKVIQAFAIGEHVDATVFDADHQLILTSTGDGFITVVQQTSPDEYTLVANAKTLRGAKTMVFDPKTRNIFLPTVENVPPGASGPPKTSGGYKPGPFEILVVEP